VIHPPIVYPSLHFHLFHSSVYPFSISLSSHLFILYLPLSLCTHLVTHLSIHLSIHPSFILQSIFPLFMLPSIHPSLTHPLYHVTILAICYSLWSACGRSRVQSGTRVGDHGI
jgi:hypothetical protein